MQEIYSPMMPAIDSDERRHVVLVADDNEILRKVFADLLTFEGHRVVCAADGEEALQLIRSQPVDLVLSDVVMPRCGGFALCRTIKANPETRLLPVVLITGLTSVEDRIHGIECGADDFLSKPVNEEELIMRVRSLLRLKDFTDDLEHAEKVLFTLALTVEAKDVYTEGHCERLSAYSADLGQRLGLDEKNITGLRRGGILHDIGKVAIPDHILLKPGPLDAAERTIMEQHAAIGERICAPLRSFRLVLPMIRHHHEKMDGSGYPDGLKGEQIPLNVRILTTVDVFDSLTTDRPYHKALSRSQAFARMREEVEWGWWDGRLVTEFESLLGK